LIPQATIKQIIAGFMLLLFAFSITPKRQIHDLVASHQDTKPGRYLLANNTAQVHKSGINCNCDQLIVESPFLGTVSSEQSKAVVFQNEFYQKPLCFSFIAPLVEIGLRGPPAYKI
jgi:hypothetical protein